MRVPGAGRLRRYARRAAGLFEHRSVILLYHRVASPTSDPQQLCVGPERFAGHLEHLQRNYAVVPLRKLHRSVLEGVLPRRSVAITFDDGYRDNLVHARPLLERYESPATVFVTTGYVGQDREFWWDELENLVLLPPTLPERLEITLGGRCYAWNLGHAARLSPEEIGSCRKWDVGCATDPSPRHTAYRDLHRMLRAASHADRDAVLATLRRQAGGGAVTRPHYRAVTADELRDLGRGELVDVGAHTVTHPVLAQETAAVQRGEMQESKQALEKDLGRPVVALSYPYGAQADVGEAAPRLAREVGFEVACANISEPVTRRSDPYLLPRFLVRDWEAHEFALRLRQFLAG